MNLRELHDAAAAGPWSIYTTKTRKTISIAFFGATDKDLDVAILDKDCPNAALIVAMRNALPALLDVAEAVGKFMAVECDESGSAFCPVDQLEAELEMNEAYTALRALEAD